MLGDLGVESSDYTVQTLTEKIIKHFGKAVSIAKSSNKQAMCCSTVSLTKKKPLTQQSSMLALWVQVEWIALHLRAVIMQLRRTCGELPSPLTAEAFTKGQACPPDVVIQFFRVLYTGSEKFSTR